MTVMATDKRPYDPRQVIYRDLGTIVWAIWVYDANKDEQIKNYNDAAFDRLMVDFSRHNDFEVVASIARSYSGGMRGAYSGWVLNDEPICKRKDDAMRHLRAAVANYTKR